MKHEDLSVISNTYDLDAIRKRLDKEFTTTVLIWAAALASCFLILVSVHVFTLGV